MTFILNLGLCLIVLIGVMAILTLKERLEREGKMILEESNEMLQKLYGKQKPTDLMICKNADNCIEKWYEDAEPGEIDMNYVNDRCPHIESHRCCSDSCFDTSCSINPWHTMLENCGCEQYLIPAKTEPILTLDDKDFLI